MSVKRQMNRPVPASKSPEEEALSSIGMRVRKAVAEGYNVGQSPEPQYSNVPAYSNIPANLPHNQAEVVNKSSHPQYRRMPLPGHIDEPPMLSNQFSTMDSTMSLSNLSGWNGQTIGQGFDGGNKRKYDDIEYGDLRLDEEF